LNTIEKDVDHSNTGSAEAGSNNSDGGKDDPNKNKNKKNKEKLSQSKFYKDLKKRLKEAQKNPQKTPQQKRKEDINSDNVRPGGGNLDMWGRAPDGKYYQGCMSCHSESGAFSDDMKDQGWHEFSAYIFSESITFGLGEFAPIIVNSFRASKGVSVIGPRSNYREFAKKIGANFLDVTDQEWTMRKNVEFLQGVVKRGDDVIFSGIFDPSKVKPGSVLAQEIRYLTRHGYKWTHDFTRLIKK
jgi:hypothetical protein